MLASQTGRGENHIIRPITIIIIITLFIIRHKGNTKSQYISLFSTPRAVDTDF